MSATLNNIKRSIIACTLIIGTVTLSKSVQASNIGLEFVSSTTASTNLLSDSSSIFDAYSSYNLKLKAYPLSFLEVALSGEQTYYRETVGLSNVLGGVNVTFIPTKRQSPLTVYLSGGISGRLYHSQFEGYNTNTGDVSFSAQYRFTPAVAFRSGVSFKSTVYVNSATSYKRDLDIFAGSNITLIGSNCLDIEAGFSKTNFIHKDNIFFEDSIPPPEEPFPYAYEDWRLDWVSESESDLWVFYYSPRLSRPLGSKTGVNLIYTHRLFQNYDDEIVYGFTTQYLSPWASVWNGQSIALNLKTYLVPRLIVSGGIGYWDKEYLKTIEQHLGYYADVKRLPARHDWQTRLYLNIKWPLALRSGWFLEPNVNFDYSHNISNKAPYYYSSTLISGGVTIRM